MAKNLRDRGYSSSMDNYNQQQEKKKRQQEQRKQNEATNGPVSTQKGLSLPKVNSTANNRAASASTQKFGPPVPAEIKTNLYTKVHNVGDNLKDKGFPSSMDDNTRPLPQKSEKEFYQSPALVEGYGNYYNYTRNRRVTKGGFSLVDHEGFNKRFEDMQHENEVLDWSNDAVLERLANAEKNLEDAFRNSGTSPDYMKFMQLQAAMESAIAGEKNQDDPNTWSDATKAAVAQYEQERVRYEHMDSEYRKSWNDFHNIYARNKARDEYKQAWDTASKMLGYSSERQKANYDEYNAYRYAAEKQRESVRDEASIQADYDDLENRIKALNAENRKLSIGMNGADIMTDVLPFFGGAEAAAAAEEQALNAEDKINRNNALIQEYRAQQQLLQAEMSYSKQMYWDRLANDMPVSAKHAVDKTDRSYNIVDEKYTGLNKVISGAETFIPGLSLFNRPEGFEKANLAQMTDGERERYKKIYENYGEAKAKEYLEELNKTDLNTRRRNDEQNRWQKYWVGSNNGVGKFATWLDTVMLKPLSMGSYANQLIDYLADGELTKDASYNRASYLNTAVRAGLQQDFSDFWASKAGEKWRGWGETGYQAVTSMLDNLWNMALTAGVGNAMEIGGSLAESTSALESLKNAEELTLMVMGTEAAADSTISAMDRGLNSDQAMVLGTGAGMIEILTEKVSLDKLFEGLGDADSLGKILRNIGIQGFTEGSEEFTGSWLDTFLDNWVAQDKSEFQQKVNEYKQTHRGASDSAAFQAVWNETLMDSLKEAGSGALSGILMAGGGSVINAGRNYVANRNAITQPSYVNALIESAKNMDQNSEGYKAAQGLQNKIDNREKISYKDVVKAQSDIDVTRRTSPDYVAGLIDEGSKYKGNAATKAALTQEKMDKGKVTYNDVLNLEHEINKAKVTSAEGLKSTIESGLASDPDSKAYKTAQNLQTKLDNNKDITVREAEAARKSVNKAIDAAFESGKAETIGRYLITENGKQALVDAATDLTDATRDSYVQQGKQALKMIKDGTIDAKTAGQAFLDAEKLRAQFRKDSLNPRILKPRKVTADMDAYDRSAARIGVSEEEAARNKAILQAFNTEGEYKSFENNNLSAYYDRSTGKVYLNANAENPGLSLIAHEVTHSFENTAAYGKLRDRIFSQKGDLNAELARITQEYADAGITLDDDGARSELVSEFVEQHMFNDEKFIKDVVSADRSLAQKFLATIDNLLAKLGNKNAQQRQLLRDARNLWAEALRQRDKSNAAKAKIEAKKSEAKKLSLPAVEAKAAAVRKTEGPKNLSLSRANDGIQAGIRQAVLTAGIDISRDSSGKLVFKIGGESVDHVTAEHIRDSSAFGAMISLARDGVVDNEGNTILKGHITEDEANEQYQAVADLMNTVMTTQNPEMVWELAGSQMFAAVKSNSDGQYGTTVDFTTVCRKTQEMITAMSERMMAKKGGLTKAEVIELQADLIEANLNVPCPVCYVFSRCAGVGTLLDNMYKFQHKYANMTDAELAEAIERLRARDKKADRARLRSDLRNPESAEFDEAYYDLVSTRERLRADNKALRKQLKTAEKNGIQADIDSLSKSIAFNNDSIKNLDKQIKDIENAADTAGKELVWLEKVRTKATYKAVPAEILFNMADGEAIESFMRDYPDSWNYRTTRGPAMGKAITPYSDMRLGDLFMSLKSNSAAAFAKGRGNVFSNPLGVKGKFNKKQMNEIVKAIARTRAQNLIGGQRFQSTSDFRYDYALDYIQTFFEAQALGSNMQTYTKIIEFGEMVAKIGGDVNLSVMPRNKGYEGGKLTYADGNYSGGTLIYSNVTGINFGAAKLLSEKYDSAQLILVGINDDHIRLALNDTTDTGGAHVGFVIPYHASGASIDTFIRELVKNLNEEFKRENYTDYSTVQTDTEKAGATALQRRLRDLRKAILTGNRTILQKVMDENGKQAVDSNGDPKFTKKTIPWIPKRSEIDFMRNLAKNKTDISDRSFEDLLDVERRALQGDPEAIRDYESWSADLLLNLYKKMWTKNGAENGVRLNSSQAAAIMPHEYWDTNSTRDTAYLNNFIFRSYCYNLGLNPRFTGIDSKGNVVDFGDFSDCRGYWKTLIDRAMYDNNGNYRAQQPINMSRLEVGMIQEEEGRKAWGDAVVKKPDVAKAREVGKQYAISKSDTAYLQAVESGDMETAQRMVDEAAREAGYSVKVYHGTIQDTISASRGRLSGAEYDGLHTNYEDKLFPFVVFRNNGLSKGIYTATDRSIAEVFRYSSYNKGTVYDLYARTKNPFQFDADGSGWANLPKQTLLNRGVNIARTRITMEDVVTFAMQNGYDSVIATNVRETGPGVDDDTAPITTDVVVFSSNQLKSADPVTYDDSGNPIPLSERFNPENKDIRYAINKAATIRTESELKLPAVQEQTEKTETRRAVKPVAESKPIDARRWLNRQTIDKFGIPDGKKKAAGQAVQLYADKMLNNGEVTEKDLSDLFYALLNEGVVDVFPDDYSRTLRELVSGGQIHATASLKADFGDDWAAFRRRAFAAGLLITNASPNESAKSRGIDMIWHELSEMSPGMFPADEYDPRAQLEKIVQVAEQGQKQQMTLPEYLAHMEKTEGMDMYETADRMLAELSADLKTFGEMAKLEVKLRDRTGTKIAQERERFGEIRDKHFTKVSEARQQERARFREAQRYQREQRQLRELQEKTMKQLKWMRKNQFRAPADMASEWADLVADMDMYAIHVARETQYSKALGMTYGDAKAMYDELVRADNNFTPSAELDRVMTRLTSGHIGDMDVDSLQAYYNALTSMRHEFYQRNNAILGDELEAFADIYTDTKANMKAQKGKMRGIWDIDFMTPVNVLKKMVGWNQNSRWMDMVNDLERGERKTRDFTVRANRLLDDFKRKNAKWLSTADGQGKNGQWIEVQVPVYDWLDGEAFATGEMQTVYMTPLQRVHLYLESKGYANMNHIAGGRTFADKDLYSQGKRSNAFAKGTTVSMNEATVKRILQDMSQEELELAKILEKFYNEFSRPYINETSQKLWGYNKAIGGYYAPIISNRNFTHQELGIGDTTAKGVGNMKLRQPHAKNASVNISALEAFDRSVQQTARFYGMGTVERNWNMLLNWQSKNTSMRDVISNAWTGKENAVDYIENLIREMQGNIDREDPSRLDKFGNRILSNYVGATFGANPGITLKQAASFPTFATVLEWKNMPSPAHIARVETKAYEDLINTYTSELAYRTMGYASPETAQLVNNPGVIQRNKAMNFLFGGGMIIAMDAATVKSGWAWSENYVDSHFDLEKGTQAQIENGESPYYKKVAEVFEDAVATTQPMYDIMHRAGIMRKSGMFTRAFTMFRTVPMQMYNSLRRSYGEFDYAKRQYQNDKTGANKTAMNKAATRAAASTAAIVVSNLALEAIEFLNALWKNRGKKYRDDDDELTVLSVAKEIGLKLIPDTAMVPVLKELTEMFEAKLLGRKWYGIQLPGGEQLNDLVDTIGGSFETITEFINGAIDVHKNGEDLNLYFKRHAREYAGALKDTVEKLGKYLGGLPLENLEKYIMGAVQFSPELTQAVEDAFKNPAKNNLKGKTGKALEKGITDYFDIRGIEVSPETAQAISALYEAGYVDVVPPASPSKLKIIGSDVELSEAQTQEWERTWASKANVNEMIASTEFQNADDTTKEKLLEKLYDYARIETNKDITDNFWTTDDKWPDKVKEYVESGHTLPEAIYGQVTGTLDKLLKGETPESIAAAAEAKAAKEAAEAKYESQTFTFKGEDMTYDELSGRQKKIVQAKDAVTSDPNADLSDIIGANNATKQLGYYQAAREAGISNETYIMALEAIDNADNGDGNYTQKNEVNVALGQLVEDGKLTEKEAGKIWKCFFPDSEKNPFPVGAIISRPMGLRLPKIG